MVLCMDDMPSWFEVSPYCDRVHLERRVERDGTVRDRSGRRGEGDQVTAAANGEGRGQPLTDVRDRARVPRTSRTGPARKPRSELVSGSQVRVRLGNLSSGTRNDRPRGHYADPVHIPVRTGSPAKPGGATSPKGPCSGVAAAGSCRNDGTSCRQ
jgi:hypothetical protein